VAGRPVSFTGARRPCLVDPTTDRRRVRGRGRTRGRMGCRLSSWLGGRSRRRAKRRRSRTRRAWRRRRDHGHDRGFRRCRGARRLRRWFSRGNDRRFRGWFDGRSGRPRAGRGATGRELGRLGWRQRLRRRRRTARNHGDAAVGSGRCDEAGGQRNGREDQIQEPHGDDKACALSGGHDVQWAPSASDRSPLFGPFDGSTGGVRSVAGAA
jgi:hypothetical protein